MPSPQQAAYAVANSVPLPTDSNLVDPNGILPTGAALSAIDPNDPQQPVGAAMDNLDGQEQAVDPVSAMLQRGAHVRITSQEQWNALSPHEKDLYRAAKAAGGAMRTSDAVRIYQDSVKRARAGLVQSVKLPDGRTVNMVNNQIIPEAKQPEPVKMEIKQAEDGTMVMIDPLTGRSFPAWNETSGEAVRGPAKLSATQEDNIKRLQLQSENIGARLDALTRFTENDSVAEIKDKNDYQPAWLGGKKVKDIRSELQDEKDRYDRKIEIALRPVNRSSQPQGDQPMPAAKPDATPQVTPSPTPSVTPSPTPRPNPMPTPEKFVVGKRYRDAAGHVKTYRGNGSWE